MKNKIQDYEFKPDTKVEIRIVEKGGKPIRDKKGNPADELKLVPAESISQTGHCLFITPVECYGPDKTTVIWYTITHKYTGVMLGKTTKNIKSLKLNARKFWRALPKEARKLYQKPTIKDDLFEHMGEMRNATPDTAIIALKEINY